MKKLFLILTILAAIGVMLNLVFYRFNEETSGYLIEAGYIAAPGFAFLVAYLLCKNKQQADGR